MAEEESEDAWRFSVDEFDDPPEDGSPTGADSSTDVEAAEDDESSVAGEFAPEMPVVPETPELENAAFVTLGAALALLVFASLVGGPTFGPLDALIVLAVVGTIGAIAYGALRRLTPDT